MEIPAKKLFLPKQKTYSLALFCIAFLLLNSCGKNVDPTHIPSEANVVAVLDFENLSSKAAGWEEMIEFTFGSSSPSTEGDLIDFLTHSGINLSSSAYFFGKLDPKSTEHYFALSFELSDAELFQKSLEASNPSTTIEDTGLKYIQLNEILLGWQENRALMLSTISGIENGIDKLKSLFNVSVDAGLENQNKEFYALLKKNYDIAVWLDNEHLNPIQGDILSVVQESFLGDLGKVPESFNDLQNLTDSFTATFHFKEGKITSEHSTKLDDKLWDKYQKLFKDKFDNSILQNMPSASPTLMVSSGLNNQGLRELLDEASMLELLKRTGRIFNITIEEMFDLITGDMVLMVDELDMEEGMQPYVQYIYGMRIQNRPKLDNLLGKLEGLFLFEKNGYYVIKMDNRRFYLIEIDDLLYVSNSKSLFEKLTQPAYENKLSNNLINAGRGHISMVYMNINQLQRLLPLENIPMISILNDDLSNMFESFQATTDRYRNNSAEGTMEIALKDKNRNALMVIIDLIKKISKNPSPI